MELEANKKTDLGKLTEALESGMQQHAAAFLSDLEPAEIARLIESLPPKDSSSIWAKNILVPNGLGLKAPKRLSAVWQN